MNSFVQEAELCINRENGHHLSDLLRMDNAEVLEGLNVLLDTSSAAHALKMGLWGELLLGHLRMMRKRSIGDEEGAFTEQAQVVLLLHRIFVSSTRWILPIVYRLNQTLWSLSLLPPQQEECARLVNKSVTICLTDRGPLNESRKWGAYKLLTLLFKIYFRLDQLNLCGNVLRAMGAADLPNPVRYPAAHLVLFRYLLGRYHFINGEYGLAEAELTLALAHCPSNHHHNKRLIMHYLIPLRLMVGTRPSDPLLSRYAMGPPSFYHSAIKALSLGDLRSYNALLVANEAALLRLGTFLVWEKLVLLGWRNFIRRINMLTGPTTSRLALNILIGPLKSMGLGMNVDEIACFVANLIDRTLLKGYISQEKATLVLSQKDPFPNPSTLSRGPLFT